jgi:hypothetical protein
MPGIGTAAQLTRDVLRAAGSALGGRRAKAQADQQTIQLDAWEDEGGAAASPKVLEPTRVLVAPVRKLMGA